jgi:hypothetical protein
MYIDIVVILDVRVNLVAEIKGANNEANKCHTYRIP